MRWRDMPDEIAQGKPYGEEHDFSLGQGCLVYILLHLALLIPAALISIAVNG